MDTKCSCTCFTGSLDFKFWFQKLPRLVMYLEMAWGVLQNVVGKSDNDG